MTKLRLQGGFWFLEILRRPLCMIELVRRNYYEHAREVIDTDVGDTISEFGEFEKSGGLKKVILLGRLLTMMLLVMTRRLSTPNRELSNFYWTLSS